MSKSGKILLAMSGGVDSSAAALILKDKGYEVIGFTIKMWDYNGINKPGVSSCCDIDAINDARLLAMRLGIAHYVIDMRELFRAKVIDNFINSYLSGYTPNPCIVCNSFIKWDGLINKANDLDCEYIATGHYSKISYENGRYFVSKGLDDFKEQSYVLWSLSQSHLARTLFPLGDYTKETVKTMINDAGFANISSKRESYDICFVSDNNYHNFLEDNVPDLKDKYSGGNIVDKTGRVIGKHKGFPFYTIGQRKGLELAMGHPVYICNIDADANEIMIGEKTDLITHSLTLENVNLQKYVELPDNIKALVKIRYKDKGKEGTLIDLGNNQVRIEFKEGVSAVTPGQSAVFYEGNDLIGGGVISKTNIKDEKG